MSASGVAVATQTVPALVKRNTFLLAVGQFVAWLGLQTLATLGSVVAYQLTGDQRWAGIPSTLFTLASAIAAQFAGRSMDRTGRKPVLLASQAAAALGMVLAGVFVLAGSFPGFLVAVAIMGGGTGGVLLARFAAADMYPVSMRSQGLSLVVMGGAAGAITGPLMLAALAGWTKTMGASHAVVGVPWIAMLIPAALSFAALALVRPDPRKIASDLAAYYPGEAHLTFESGPARPLAQVLKLRPVVVGIGSTALVQAGMIMVMVTTSLSMTLAGHADSVYGVMTGHFFGMLGLSFLIGRVTDRLGRRPVLIAAGLVFATGALTAPLFQNPLYNAGSLFLVGLGWSLCYVAGNTLLADCARPAERGRVVGANDMIVGIVGSVAALVAGVLMGVGGYFVVAIAGLALAVVQISLALSLHESEPGVYAAG